MEQRGFQLDQEKLCCSICLDLLKDPVALTCGHSYCMSCINKHWDQEAQSDVYSCPQCRETFRPRPVLKKNTMLADLVEGLKKTGLQAAPADHCYAGPGDVACDFCTGRKLKAVKSCLQCVVSYCEQHLQPHYKSIAFKKHKLVDPSEKLQVNFCSRHNEVMKIFCRTDHLCICYLCAMDEHKGHDTVSAAAERTERQGELGMSRRKIQQRIQERDGGVKVIQRHVETLNESGDKAVRNTENIYTDMIGDIQKKMCDVKQQIRSKQEYEVRRGTKIQEKLQQEISDLRRRDAELEQLSNTEDHIQFLQRYSSLSNLSESAPLPRINMWRLLYFEDVTAAASKSKDQLHQILSGVKT